LRVGVPGVNGLGTPVFVVLRFMGKGHPRVEFRGNSESISQSCHLFEVAFLGELAKETIHVPLRSGFWPA